MSLRQVNRVGLVFGLALLAAACADPFSYRPLALISAPDCAERPARLGSLAYWILGRSGPTVNWAGCDLAEAQLARSDLSGAELAGARLSGANLAGADLGGAHAEGTDFTGADLRDAVLISTYFKGANLRGANLAGAEVTPVQLDGVPLSGATWIDGTVCAEGSVGACKG